MKALIWVQHLLGAGHLQRAGLLAEALAGAGHIVTLASGGMPRRQAAAAGIRFVQLPPCRAADATFKTLLDDTGRPIDEDWRIARRDRLLALFDETAPDLLITEHYPFGRRQLRFELTPLIARARSAGTMVVSSVRDVLVGMDRPERAAWAAARVEAEFDHVLVHGDPAVIPFAATFPEAHRIATRLSHTGYLVPPIPAGGRIEGDTVLVSAGGGGAVGAGLFRAALAARPLSAARDLPWRLLVGDAALRADLAAIAPQGVSVEGLSNDFVTMLRHCRLSVSQAGYNTVMEITAVAARAVVVPFSEGQESEQQLRAEALAARGALHLLAEPDLTPAALAATIDRALAGPAPASAALDRNGAARSVELLGRWVGR